MNEYSRPRIPGVGIALDIKFLALLQSLKLIKTFSYDSDTIRYHPEYRK